MPNIMKPANQRLAQPRSSPRNRLEAGRSQRESVPLEAHAEVPGDERRTDPLAVLSQQNGTRLAELVPLRYGRMSYSPFTYLRGAAAVMANDLASGPRTEIWVELCGDAHLGNFRWYNAPDRAAVFDLNDFDETLPGPFEWDVKRLAASIMVCGRNGGFSKKKCREATRAGLTSYRESIAEASELSPLDLFYFRIDSRTALERIEKAKHREWKEGVLLKAARKNSQRALRRLTRVVDGRRAIVLDPPRVQRVDDELSAGDAAAFFRSYLETLPLDRRVLLDRFSVVDVARRVVGVGSVGTRCLVVLLESGDGTPLFLQLKQAMASVLEPHLGASVFEQSGQRVVEGQRLIQATSDMFLGWARWKGVSEIEIDFYCRQLWDGKGKIDVELLSPKRLAGFAALCGKTLAYAHARSGDAMTIRGYIGEDETFDEAVVEYAVRYAGLTEADHAQLTASIDDGAIEVIREAG